MSLKIPILSLGEQVESLWPDLQEAFERVMRSGQYILGPEVAAFEQEAAEYLGTKHAIGVNSGTDALVIALRAAGVGPGDEVITTPFSFFATAESISNVGATPVFVDIDGETFDIDASLIEQAITDNTKAILPVHLYGRPADMDQIMEIAAAHDLAVIEDCAQAFGATHDGRKVGTIGTAGAYSFFPTKNLGTFGDGGLIATNEDHVAEVSRMLRAHGGRKKYHNEMLGYNSRLDALHAAFLRIKLKHIDAWNQARRAVAQRYHDGLGDLPGIILPTIADGHVFHQFTIRVTGDRDGLQQKLAAAGIGSMIYYPVPQDQLPVYGGRPGRYPVSDQAAREVLSLPIWPELDAARQQQVIDAVRIALQQTRG